MQIKLVVVRAHQLIGMALGGREELAYRVSPSEDYDGYIFDITSMHATHNIPNFFLVKGYISKTFRYENLNDYGDFLGIGKSMVVGKDNISIGVLIEMLPSEKSDVVTMRVEFSGYLSVSQGDENKYTIEECEVNINTIE